MVVFNFLNRIFQPNKIFCTIVFPRKSHNISFLDPRMPDKLYKTVELEIKSSDRAVMRSYEYFIKSAAEHLNIIVGKVFSSKKPTYRRFTLLKSVFVHRKHLVQYEIRTNYTWIHLNKLTGSTADTFLEYIERMLPEGVALKVTRISLEPLPEHIVSQVVDNENQLSAINTSPQSVKLKTEESSQLCLNEKVVEHSTDKSLKESIEVNH